MDADDATAPAHSGALARLRTRWPEMVIEMFSILLAISLAFAVDEWADAHKRRQEAAELRAAIVAEMARNASDIADSQPRFDQTVAGFAEQVQNPPQAGDSLHINFGVALFGDAAYRVMQASTASSELDLEWRIAIAQVYALQGIVNERQQRVLDAIIALRSGPDGKPDPQRIHALLAELDTLGQLRAGLARAYRDVGQ